jgi:TRAP-type uncharacterized transport system fused permease subunit
LSAKVRKEPQFKQKILADLGQLESVERHWLASILAGIIVGAVDITIFLQHFSEILNGQPATFSPLPFLIVIAAAAVLLVMGLAAFVQYFSFELRVSVGRGMVIKKKRGHSNEGTN